MADTETKVEDDKSETPERIAQRKADRDGYVPFTRAQSMAENAVQREREAAEKRIADLEKRVTAQPEAAKREYTRGELQGFVNAGKISQDDANALWDQQLETRITTRVDATLTERLTTDRRAVATQEKVNRYKSLIPEMLVPDSEARKKVEKQFQALVDMGQPSDPEQGGLHTELLALHTVFGPADALQQSRTELQTHQESDARGGPGEDGSTQDGWPKGLSARQKAHYEDQIRKGILKSKEDVVKLYERVSKRRGARA